MKIVNTTCRAILRKQILKVFFTFFDNSAGASFGALDKLELESTIQLFRFSYVFLLLVAWKKDKVIQFEQRFTGSMKAFFLPLIK